MCQKVLPGVVAQQVQGDVQLVMKAEYNRPASRRLGGAGAAFEDFCDAVQQLKEFGEGEPCSRVIWRSQFKSGSEKALITAR